MPEVTEILTNYIVYLLLANLGMTVLTAYLSYRILRQFKTSKKSK